MCTTGTSSELLSSAGSDKQSSAWAVQGAEEGGSERQVLAYGGVTASLQEALKVTWVTDPLEKACRQEKAAQVQAHHRQVFSKPPLSRPSVGWSVTRTQW